VIMALIKGGKVYYYLVHVVPAYCALLAIWIHEIWGSRKSLRPLAAGLAMLYAFLNVGWIANEVHRDTWHHEYAEVIQCVRSRARPDDLIVGPAHMGFAFGFYDHVVEDGSIGYYTGRRPRWIIADERGFGEALRGYPRVAPYLDRYITALLAEQYRLVCRNREYLVYEKK